MKKLLILAIAVLLAGCNSGQKIEGGLYRQYDKEKRQGEVMSNLLLVIIVLVVVSMLSKESDD